MTDLRDLLRRSDPDRLTRDAIGLAALCAVILVGLFLPGLA